MALHAQSLSPTLPNLQRAIGNPAVPPPHAAVRRTAVDHVLASPGQPIAAPLRGEMEARLGADFSRVRVHTDRTARASAAEMGARAYTWGSHVVIGDGDVDKHTLAHELTHVIQQRQGPVAGTGHGSGLKVSDPSGRDERAAEANAARVMRGPVRQRRRAPDGTGHQVAGGLAVSRPVQGLAGRELIAHELTHVAQQAGSGSAGEGVIQRTLYQVNSDQVFDDDRNITATRDTNFPHIFVGDTDGQGYNIGPDSSGNHALVPASQNSQVTGMTGTPQHSVPIPIPIRQAPAWNPDLWIHTGSRRVARRSIPIPRVVPPTRRMSPRANTLEAPGGRRPAT